MTSRPPSRSRDSARLLEREDQLAALVQAAEDAARGNGRVVLVAGEAGIGKTSLVRAFQAAVRDPVTFASGACEPLSVPVPLAPLRELVEAVGGGDIAAPGSDDPWSIARGVLSALADRRPLVAVVEDAHWADPLTLDLLRILTRRVEEAGVVLVLTYRDDEVGANPPLGLLLGDLVTLPAVQRIALRPLSGAAIGELAAGSGLDSAGLMQATGGNPFLVTEAIAAGGRLPASVRDAALARAGRLGRAARDVVDIGAVVGQRFDAGLLRALVGECTDAVEEALSRGVLVANGAALGFRHELIREAIEHSISPPRRAELHARVFRALTERSEAADAPRLAHHAELGELTQEAAFHAMLAAGEAERIGALRETYLQADRALRLGGHLAPTERFELLVQYARAANFANPRLEDAVVAAERAVTLAEELGDDRRRGRALMALSYALWSLERVVDARAAAMAAIAAFEPTDDAASLAWAYATRIRIEATSFDPADAVAMAPRALQLADEAQLAEVRIDVAISAGLARGHRGEREALEVLSDALGAARRGGFTIRAVRAYVNLMTVAVALREAEYVDRIAAEALAVLEEWNVSAMPIMAIRLFRARSVLDRGRWDDALETAGSRERWWRGEFAVACAMEGLIRARRGEADASGLVEQAWTDINDNAGPEGARHGMIRLALVEAAWLRDDRSAALAALRDARESPAVAWFARSAGELALWGSRLGVEFDVPAGVPAPVALELDGDWRAAVDAWRELQAPYEAALAAIAGDDRAAREAMAALHKLRASAAARAFVRERSARGARAARGPRGSTLANPAGLTRREQQVLEALETGASNALIAARLHLSERTVAHHVSAILRKLDAANRHVAIDKARRMGLLAESAR